MLYYKPMKLEDCNKLRDMDASQKILRAWREVDGRLQLIALHSRPSRDSRTLAASRAFFSARAASAAS